MPAAPAKPSRTRNRAKTKASKAPATRSETDFLALEAQRMADLAAEFALFGLRIDTLEPDSWTYPADLPYRTVEPPGAEPANESEPRAPLSEAETIALEARRMGDLAAQFSLFGLRIDALEEADWAPPDASQATCGPACAAAYQRGFPTVSSRGATAAPGLPAAFMQALDWLFVIVIAELAARWSEGAGVAELEFGHAVLFLAAAICLKAGLWLTEFYRFNVGSIRPDRSIGGLAIGAVAGLIVANLLAPDVRSAAALAAILPASAILMAGVHAALAVWIGAAHRAGVFAETVVIIGATGIARRFLARAEKTGDVRVLAVVDDRRTGAKRRMPGVSVAGNVTELLKWDGLPHVDRVIIALPSAAEARVHDLVNTLRVLPNRVDLLLDYDAQSVRGPGFERSCGFTMASMAGQPHCHRRAMVKRVQDIAFGTLLFLVFAAPMLAIALAIKLDSKGPVLFRQHRHGLNNRVITLLKFRTMHAQAPRDGDGKIKQGDVTRVGRLLRRTSLDELPQIFNVLGGDMSLVGPRPHEIEKTAGERPYHHVVADYAHRHRVKPGITGWAQVNGCRGAIKTAASLRRRHRLDIDYIAHASLWLDLQILARTAAIMVADMRAALEPNSRESDRDRAAVI